MIYIHVPFCRSFCTYCGFYSEVAPKSCSSRLVREQESQFEEYVSALESEIKERQDDIAGVFASNDVNTLYIGGGTPSVLPLEAFRRIVTALRQAGAPEKYSEFTVEVNPEDVVEKGVAYIQGLMSLGVNRISMGVQSFDDGILKWMNRRHTASGAVEAYRILEDAGVENISIDLIFGLPQLTDRLWEETLERALNISSRGIRPNHISAYQLSIEEDSALEKMIAGGFCAEASEEMCQRQYSMLCNVLSDAGYVHYEVSNFAREGFEAKHNSAYWRHVPYVGLGPAAHSYMSESARQWNLSDVNAYVKAAEAGDFAAVRDGEQLEQEQMDIETVMLALRTSAGVNESLLRRIGNASAVCRVLEIGNLVRLQGGNVRIPENRFFISDNIISSIV